MARRARGTPETGWGGEMYLAIEFLIGQLLNIIKRADLVIQSPHNTTGSVKQYVLHYGVQLIFQLAFGVALFNGVLANDWLLGMIWKPLATVKWTASTAFFAGLIFDNLMDWAIERFPVLRQFLQRGDPNATSDKKD
jgi:hypothetical protein